MHHYGPLLDEYKKSPRKYNWPDWRVQVYFRKTVSPLWTKKLEAQYTYDDDTLVFKLRKIAHDDGIGGVILPLNFPF